MDKDIQTVLQEDLELHVINNSSNKVVVYSHGFGASWNAKNIFTDIAEELGSNFDYVSFNYNRTDENGAYVEDLGQQMDTFRKVLDYAETKEYEEINIITHSFGAVVPLKLNPKNTNRLVMISPPTEIDTKKQRDMLKNRAGSFFNPNGYSTYVKSDGSKTNVNITFYDSIDNIKAIELFNNNKVEKKHIVIALEDEVTNNSALDILKLKRDIVVTKIHGDHNFTGENRATLLQEIKRILS